MAAFVNVSNHPSSRWDSTQREAALRLAQEEAQRRGLSGGDVEIVDIPFPEVDPEAGPEQVLKAAQELAAAVPDDAAVVMAQGEFTLTYALVHLLHARGIPVCAATSKRQVVELGDGRKVAEFRFVRFRFYPYCRSLLAG